MKEEEGARDEKKANERKGRERRKIEKELTYQSGISFPLYPTRPILSTAFYNIFYVLRTVDVQREQKKKNTAINSLYYVDRFFAGS